MDWADGKTEVRGERREEESLSLLPSFSARLRISNSLVPPQGSPLWRRETHKSMCLERIPIMFKRVPSRINEPTVQGTRIVVSHILIPPRICFVTRFKSAIPLLKYISVLQCIYSRSWRGRSRVLVVPLSRQEAGKKTAKIKWPCDYGHDGQSERGTTSSYFSNGHRHLSQVGVAKG